ncbi:DUF5979 domain-containing protein [Microbacterium sp. M28]|uniref:DUF5979 domain-containing protein n=1 Tax=Microbacterium sp. M28 TaxID=2962064 RepID=UPI0021F492EE|nr:DUF5979 domain-containing protein [Microbacterium sp. M28]UYO96592.1 DUF5979 domain-containing protein [Microbacterium sp. M28]
MPHTPARRARRLISALTAGAIALTGAIVAPLTEAEPAEAAYPDTFNPLAMNGGFTVYAREDIRLGNQETEGSIAAGGTATKPGDSQYTIIHVAAGTGDYSIPSVDGDPTRLLVGAFSPDSGGITAITSAGTSDPALQGDLKMVERDGPWEASARGDWLRLNLDASSPDRTPLIDATAQAYPGDAAPPGSSAGNGSIYTADTSSAAVADYVEANAEATYDDATACLAQLPDSAHQVAVAEDDGDRVVLAPLSPDQVNLVDYADIAGASLIQFSAGPTPGVQNPLVIQVPAGTTSVSGARIDPQGMYSPYMLWDLSQVTGDVTIDAAGVRMDGSIYAPNATVTVNAAPLDGQVLAQNVILEGGEVHSFLFAGSIACNASDGTFRIRKALEGIDPEQLPAGTTFTVNFTATEPDGTETTGALELPADGSWVAPPGSFPTGTVIAFDEISPESVPGYEWGDATITPSQITIGTGTADVIVTNTATAQTGTFSVSKVIEVLDSEGAPLQPEGTVPVNWTAFYAGEQIGSGTLEVPLDGTSVPVGEEFPVGTRIVLVEDRSGVTPPDGYHWVGSGWDPGRTFLIDDDTTVAVALTNTIAPDDATRTISIVKSATGADADYEYTVSYNTDPAPSRTDRVLPLGDPQLLGDVETDAETLQIAEHVPTLDGAPTDPAGWQPPVFRVTADGMTTEYPATGFEDDVPLEDAIVDIPLPATGDVVIEVANERKAGTFELNKAFASGIHLPPGLEFSVSWTATTPGGEVTEGVLRLPGDGTPVGPADAAGDPLQFPYGTQITYGELQPPAVAWIVWMTPVEASSGELVIGENDQATVSATITNVHSVRTGTFTVVKDVVGIDPDDLLVDSFTVDYEARLPLGDIETGSIELPADGTAAGPVDGNGNPVTFPIGTVVSLNEIEPDASALPPSYVWGETTWTPSSSFLVRGGTAQLEVTNTAVEQTRFSVVKEVTGDASSLVPSDTVFPVLWAADLEPQEPLNAGIDAPAVSPYLPVGTIVELREGQRPVIDGVQWGPVTWSADGADLVTEPGGVVALHLDGGDAPDPIALTMTNTADSAPTSAFSIAKTVTGDGAPEVPTDTTYALEYTIDGGEVQTTTVRAGETVGVSGIPSGAELRIREVAPPAVDDVTWEAATWTVDGRAVSTDADGWASVALVEGQSIEFSLVNHADAPDGGGDLPKTGGEGVAPWVTLAALMLVTAGIVLIATRRRAV